MDLYKLFHLSLSFIRSIFSVYEPDIGGVRDFISVIDLSRISISMPVSDNADAEFKQLWLLKSLGYN